MAGAPGQPGPGQNITGVAVSLDETLKDTLAARKLQSEQAGECPAQYRSFVDAYFEALSKAAAVKAPN